MKPMPSGCSCRTTREQPIRSSPRTTTTSSVWSHLRPALQLPGPTVSRRRAPAARGGDGAAEDLRRRALHVFTLRDDFRFCRPPTSRSPPRLSRAFERALDPAINSYGATIARDIVGAHEYRKGDASGIAGLSADGQTLTIELVRPVPNFVERLSTPWFCSVPPPPRSARRASTSFLGRPLLRRLPRSQPQPRPSPKSQLRRRPPRRERRSTTRLECRPNAGPWRSRTGRLRSPRCGRRRQAARRADRAAHGGVRPGQRGRQRRQPAALHPALAEPLLLRLPRGQPGLHRPDVRRAVASRPRRRSPPPASARPASRRISSSHPASRATRMRRSTRSTGPTSKPRGDWPARRAGTPSSTCDLPECTRHAQILRSNLAAIGIDLDVRLFPLGEFFERIYRPESPGTSPTRTGSSTIPTRELHQRPLRRGRPGPRRRPRPRVGAADGRGRAPQR